MARGDSYLLQGQQGGHFLNAGEGAQAGPFRAIEILTDTVLAGITNAPIENIADIVGVTLPAGTWIGGATTSIELTSGEAIGYAL